MISTICRADDAVRFKDTNRSRQQSTGLRQLEKDSGRKRSAIVAELDEAIRVGHDQYRRYLRGDTSLNTGQFDAFARAFKVTTAELTRAIGLLDDEPDAALMGRCVEALGECSDDETARTVERNLRPLSSAEQADQLSDIRAGVAGHQHS